VVNYMLMGTEKVPAAAFLRELMRRRKRLPSQLAAELGVNHATVSRWLSGEDIPSTRSCRRLAEPEFREYALQKYPDELDDDMITMIEDLIERKRGRRYEHRKDA